MKYFEWKQNFSVNVKIIDAQHQHFVNILNRIYSTCQSNSFGELEVLINELFVYAQLHFETEEKYFKKFKYSGAKEHIEEHKKIVAKVTKFLTKKNDDPIKTGFELIDFLEDWLVDHLAVMDKKYTACFNEHGLL